MLFIKLYIYQKILRIKCITISTQNMKQQNNFQHDNNQKCFLSQINVNISNDFGTENKSNDEENSTLHHRNNITFYNILQWNTFFKCVILFHNIAVFCFFTLIK